MQDMDGQDSPVRSSFCRRVQTSLRKHQYQRVRHMFTSLHQRTRCCCEKVETYDDQQVESTFFSGGEGHCANHHDKDESCCTHNLPGATKHRNSLSALTATAVLMRCLTAKILAPACDLRSIALAVCQGMDSDDNAGSAGMIVQGDAGGGKTLLLQTMRKHFGCICVGAKDFVGHDSRYE